MPTELTEELLKKHYIIYVRRPDVPYAIYKKMDIVQDLPNFVKMYEDDGKWTGHDTKYNDAPVLTTGKFEGWLG